MQARQVRELRRRKFEIYSSLLPPGSLAPVTSELGDDADYAALLSEVARVAPPGFGLSVGLQRSMSDLGVLGHVTMSCATLEEVFQLWMVYADSAGELANFEAAMDVDGEAQTWALLIKPYSYLPMPVQALLTDELCAMFFGLAYELTGREFADFDVHLAHPPEPGVDYLAAFPRQVVFNTPVACVTGPAAALELSIVPMAGDPLALMIEELGGDRRELQRTKPTMLHLYDFLIRRRGRGSTLKAAAVALYISERTLVRRLAAEQTSYGAVLDDFRRRYAMTLAKYGGLKAKQIAYLVGFQSENSLRKAFKKWAGQPIGAWAAASSRPQSTDRAEAVKPNA